MLAKIGDRPSGASWMPWGRQRIKVALPGTWETSADLEISRGNHEGPNSTERWTKDTNLCNTYTTSFAYSQEGDLGEEKTEAIDSPRTNRAKKHKAARTIQARFCSIHHLLEVLT